MKAFFYILLGILAVALFLSSVGLIIGASLFALYVGLNISFFVGIFLSIKNCIIGINKSITNIFMKIIMFISIGVAILTILLLPFLPIIVLLFS